MVAFDAGLWLVFCFLGGGTVMCMLAVLAGHFRDAASAHDLRARIITLRQQQAKRTAELAAALQAEEDAENELLRRLAQRPPAAPAAVEIPSEPAAEAVATRAAA